MLRDRREQPVRGLSSTGASSGDAASTGLAGNRLLRDEVGEHALARFDRDVLSAPGVTHVLVHRGINDSVSPAAGEPPATAEPSSMARAPAPPRCRSGAWTLVRDGGPFVGVRPSSVPGTERGITVGPWSRTPRRAAERLIDPHSVRRLPARVHAVVPLDQAADASTPPWPRAAVRVARTQP